MYEYIKGTVAEATPTYVVVECGGIGYYVNVTLNTYSRLAAGQDILLYLHLIVREDAHLLYGFFTREERALFRQLIAVSGIGANTAGVVLSSMTVDEVVNAIVTENVNAIKSVKGIGLKTAQRVIIELKDKVAGMGSSAVEFVPAGKSAVKEEALAALVMLGFVRGQASKVLDKLVASNSSQTVEELIKAALKQL